LLPSMAGSGGTFVADFRCRSPVPSILGWSAPGATSKRPLRPCPMAVGYAHDPADKPGWSGGKMVWPSCQPYRLCRCGARRATGQPRRASGTGPFGVSARSCSSRVDLSLGKPHLLPPWACAEGMALRIGRGMADPMDGSSSWRRLWKRCSRATRRRWTGRRFATFMRRLSSGFRCCKTFRRCLSKPRLQ
jgi:hypothetical protein